MEKDIYYPEETLVEKVQSGEYGWLEYVNHHSKIWKAEFEKYCRLRGLTPCEDAAWRFVEMKQEELDQAIANGEA